MITTPNVNVNHFLRHLDTDELIDLVALSAERPADSIESDPSTWGPEWDAEQWTVADHSAADEQWWSLQDRTGGCLESDLSPEERRYWQCDSALQHHLDELAAESEALRRHEAGCLL